MAQAVKQGAQMTPGKRSKKGTNNQYFDVGGIDGFGRKTGITLRDTGIRDEHGLEPVSGIFSSPVFGHDEPDELPEDVESDSEDFVAGPNTLLSSRVKPSVLPARNSTPKNSHTSSRKRDPLTGSATRSHGSEDELSPVQSKTHPHPIRQLDFTGKTNRSRKSIAYVDSQSPFRPKKVLRRSVGPVHVDQPVGSQTPHASNGIKARDAADEVEHEDVDADADQHGEFVERSIEIADFNDDAPLVFEDGHSEVFIGDQAGTSMLEPRIDEVHNTSLRLSVGKAGSPSMHQQHTPPTAVMMPPSSGRKRDRSSLQAESDDGDMGPFSQETEQGAQPSKRKRKVHTNNDQAEAGPSKIPETIDPSLLAPMDEGIGQSPDDSAAIEEQIRPELEAEIPKAGRGRQKGKGKAQAQAQAILKERDPNRAMRNSQSPSVGDEKPATSQTRRGGSSNVHLRSTTPFEDAEHRTSRSGRALIKPLKYWENESVIWNKGSIEGIVRADPVVKLETKTNRRKRRGRKRGPDLEDIQEESETESNMPDEWEETHGVISGKVARWNPMTNAGDPNDPVEEDLAFAAPSILTREVAGADFKFAKILTIPFFGAGIVELPPEGFKRAKNSRKMHMLFFVHEGKVMVEVGATGMEVNQFALTKGGCWSVPRGNNYAIMNESRTRSAKVFFAQGCEVEAGGLLS